MLSAEANCGRGDGKEQADCSLPLTGLSLPEGRVAAQLPAQLGSPQKETGTVSRRAVNSGLGTNPLVFNTETGRSKKCVQKELWARRASPPHARPRTGMKEGRAQATAVRVVMCC